MTTPIRYTSYPKTEPPPAFVNEVVSVFSQHIETISTPSLSKGLTSDNVLETIRDGLVALGFSVEAGKRQDDKITRPVFFGENGVPVLRYEIDAYHPAWKCGLEVEAGRALMGNAVYRDLIQALVMVDIDVLVLAVPLSYKYKNGDKIAISKDYEKTTAIADALYGHSRIQLPYKLIVIGY